MDRIRPGGYAPLIEAAYELIPTGLHQWIRPHFLCGTDPVFAGLHRYEAMSHSRSYRATMHVAYDFHQPELSRARRRTTVVLPEDPRHIRLRELVHELGHVLDSALGFEHVAEPVSWYGETSQIEAFAEAFTAWVLPPGEYDDQRDRLYATDRHTVALFEGLAA